MNRIKKAVYCEEDLELHQRGHELQKEGHDLHQEVHEMHQKGQKTREIHQEFDEPNQNGCEFLIIGHELNQNKLPTEPPENLPSGKLKWRCFLCREQFESIDLIIKHGKNSHIRMKKHKRDELRRKLGTIEINRKNEECFKQDQKKQWKCIWEDLERK